MSLPLYLIVSLAVIALVLIEYFRRSAARARIRARHQEEDLRLLRSEMESMEQFRTELLVRVGAEIHGPLSSIRNRAESLAQPILTEMEIRASTENMRRDLDQLDHYLDSLGEILELHQLESSSEGPPLRERGEVVSMDDILSAALHAESEAISSKGLSLAVSSDSGVYVRGDRDYLERALIELISQTVVHAAPGTVLHLQLSSTDEGKVHLQIGFAGAPLSEAATSALLVALARQIISAHGGSLASTDQPGNYTIELEGSADPEPQQGNGGQGHR